MLVRKLSRPGRKKTKNNALAQFLRLNDARQLPNIYYHLAVLPDFLQKRGFVASSRYGDR